MKTTEKKPKTANVIMVKMPTKYEGLDLYAELDGAILGGRKTFEAKVPVRGRSLPQNSLWAVWYVLIGKETGQTPEEVKRECKLLYGVPLLMGQDNGFRAMWLKLFDALPYEQKLYAMRFISVTSTLSKMNGSNYTEAMQREYAKNNIKLYCI